MSRYATRFLKITLEMYAPSNLHPRAAKKTGWSLAPGRIFQDIITEIIHDYHIATTSRTLTSDPSSLSATGSTAARHR